MKKLILLLIMILLAAAWSAYASEELDNVIAAEEGSAYFDPTYGAKLISGAQTSDNGEYEVKLTKEEQDSIRSLLAAETGASDGSTTLALADLRSAIGEANLTATDAVTTISFADYLSYLMLMHGRGFLTQNEINQRITTIQNQMPQLYNPQTYTTLVNQQSQTIQNQIGPAPVAMTLGQFAALPQNAGLPPELISSGYNNGYLPGFQQYVAAPYWTQFDTRMDQSFVGNWTTPLTQDVINSNYQTFSTNWWNNYNGQVAQIPQPPIESQASYDARNAQIQEQNTLDSKEAQSRTCLRY